MTTPYGPSGSWFPTPYSIPYYAWTGSPSNVNPETGNQYQTWADPVMVDVQGWDIYDSAKLPHAQREIKIDMYLMVPPTFWPGINDRFGIPLAQNGLVAPMTMFSEDGDINVGIFEVTGHDIETFGFANWAPGNVILLAELI